MWWMVTIGSVSIVANNLLFSDYSIKFLFYVIFQALAVYFNLYFLMPRFLEKGKYIQYLFLLLTTIIVTASCIASGYYVSSWLSGKTLLELYQVKAPNYFFYFFQINTLPSTAASITLAMSVKLTKNWIQTRRREQLLEKEKLETELKFLKSQFNPHFLFNTINSIFVLIHKNPAMASDSLAKFSDLLRYQLYECNEQQIPLGQELDYLENFIELGKLRQEQNTQVIIQVDQQHTGNLTIAPFILMPFVENAFKHVSQGKNRLNWIKMNLRFNKNLLHFDISNSISTQRNVSGELLHYSGIGLKNVQRRLDLLYPGKHELIIEQTDDQFRIVLQLNLYEHKIIELPAMPVKANIV
jgi:two-component system, LytTR family, sensor kinase